MNPNDGMLRLAAGIPFLFPRFVSGGGVADIQFGGSTACLKMALSGASMSFFSGVWCWLDDNSRVIATLAAIVGAIVGGLGLYLQHRMNRKRFALEERVAEHRIRSQQRDADDGSGSAHRKT